MEAALGSFHVPLSAHCLKGSGQEVISLPRSCHIGVSELTQWFTVLHPGRLGTDDRDVFLHLDTNSSEGEAELWGVFWIQ